MELENTSSDLTSVFPGFDFGTLSKNATNLEGIAIHCSLADSTGNGVCAHGETDNLPDEPAGYGGFKGLFGAFQVNPVLTGGSYDGRQHGARADLRRVRAGRDQHAEGGRVGAPGRG